MLGFSSSRELIEPRRNVARQEYVKSEQRDELVPVPGRGVVLNFEYHVYRKDEKVI